MCIHNCEQDQSHGCAIMTIPDLNSDFRRCMTFLMPIILELGIIIVNVTDNAAIIRTATIIVAEIPPAVYITYA